MVSTRDILYEHYLVLASWRLGRRSLYGADGIQYVYSAYVWQLLVDELRNFSIYKNKSPVFLRSNCSTK